MTDADTRDVAKLEAGPDAAASGDRQPPGEPPLDFTAFVPPPMPFTCPDCGGGVRLNVRCWDCEQRITRVAKRLEAFEASIPETFRWARFGAPLLADRVAGRCPLVAAAEVAVDCPRVVLVGESGAGKTSLAIAMAREWVKRNAKPAVFAMATTLGSSRMRSFGREAEEVKEAFDAPLLVLDNLGQDAAVGSSPIVEIIEWRHAHARPLWITTWLDRAGLASRYDGGTARRVLEGARILHCAREVKP